MRLLFAIPHYHRDSGGRTPEGRWHASLASAPPRISALTACISSIHQLFSTDQRIIDQKSLQALPVNQPLASEIEILVCTTSGHHILDQLPLPAGAFQHMTVKEPPLFLGFACHAALAERRGAFDYFVYLEDDLIIRDPWLFRKLLWFNSHVGDASLLQPNRYEVTLPGFIPKAYIDGDIAPQTGAAYQNLADTPELASTALGTPLRFIRPSNPHSGCFFLNQRQMHMWASQPYFLDRDASFVGPLESAATLGVMRTFKIYKPAPENASFLEIEHYGNGFISQLRLG
jgi:hypothetical protein